ncbi:MAG: glycine/sarcosine/betaine reductase selenoprotein B family protein [Actinomycetota bacterium]|nr:glycine/sarcosine/betaine reductase selenoprotein B family protein [Actinomycetota bacterium]
MGADEGIREAVGQVPVPDLGDPPAVTAPPLADARVAIVTTAGLRPADDVTLWQTTDASFTVLPGEARDLRISHFSPNFDRAAFAADINTVYPVDRLAELAEQGVIGSVASRHLSFMGAQADASFTAMRLESGPAAAEILRRDGVDVVLLTPV